MKRTLLFASATLLAFGLAFGQTLNVTRPTGGERWTLERWEYRTRTHQIA